MSGPQSVLVFGSGSGNRPEKKMRTIYKALKKEIKDNIRRQYHYTCQRCGKRFPKGEKEKLTVHHGDKKPYCRKCHDEIERELKTKTN